MKKLSRILAAALIIVGALGISAAPVSAATQGVCTKDTEFIRIRENSLGVTSDGDDMLNLCTSAASLHAISHTIPGNCLDDLFGIFSTNWGDCTNAAYLWVPAGRRVCVYIDTNYGGIVLLNKAGPLTGAGFNFLYQDRASSVKFIPNNGTTC